MKAKTLPPGADVGAQWRWMNARLLRDRMIEDLDNSVQDFCTDHRAERFQRAKYSRRDSATFLCAGNDLVIACRTSSKSQGEKTFAIANLRDQVRQAELSYKMAKVRLRPMLGLNAYWSQQPTASVGRGYVQQYITQTRNIDLIASWSIFDGLATRGAKLSALSSKRGMERSLRTTQAQMLAQVRDLEKQLGFSWRALSLSQQRRDMAEGGLNGTIDYVKRGLLSATDIGAARMGFYQAELALAAARADFLNQWSVYVSRFVLIRCWPSSPTAIFLWPINPRVWS